ncbi:uncharacterized protein I206_100193 [Kwoniella pini CBS 10737]|uniref:Zn(2)-C6 fungal-type domain-containing protein n=1 Tax=Kwoniella pini CBS 10737 TaxID=1296096 RepID=A0A1B9IE19_9TREE|nr:uncharacterized protein I206_01132 [Kwoniella pini CBS 10737]OCF53825.1 hypothetical protein I206_01132 [Kwoniella pini CBS 10737]
MSYSQPQPPLSQQGSSYIPSHPPTPNRLQINIPPVPIPSGPPSSSRLPDGDNEQEGYPSDVDVDGELDVEQDQNRSSEGFAYPPMPTRRETFGSLSGSTDSMVDGSGDAGEPKEQSNKRKPRITLPRGRACVACRKCTGDVPCRTCQKAGLECRYEELPRKKPRAVILEERVAELEACLSLRPNDPVPPRPQSSNLSSGTFDSMPQSSTSSSSGPPNLSLISHIDVSGPMASLNPPRADIMPNSELELVLIQFILPLTPFIGIPLHPARFLALLSLPPNDIRRPHPALLYILFSQAVRTLELDRPPPQMPPRPQGVFPQTSTQTIPKPSMDRTTILSQVGGTSLMLCERARAELDRGIRTVDRPFDLTRAAIGIAWMLYSMGHFIEGWNIPVSRLLISCGLHRITGTYIPPDGGSGINPDLIPKPYAASHQYAHSHSQNRPSNPFPNNGQSQVEFPIVRMRPIIIPPARDEIELAERVATFWAAKMQDWEASIGWGWSVAMSDELCTTEWGWGWGTVQPKHSANLHDRHGIRDLYDPASTMHLATAPETTYVLAIKSVALLHRASALYDLPESSYPITLPDGQVGTSYSPPFSVIQSVQMAIQRFRQRIPRIFLDFTQNVTPPSGVLYDGLSDPWWIMVHSNLYTAEMMCWRELANYQANVYENAVRSARAHVSLVRRIPDHLWANMDLVVALNLSLTSRFLFKESTRLLGISQPNAETAQMAAVASNEAEILRQALSGPFNRYHPIAGMHSLIVQRVREGWPEKEGEYERI